MTTLYKNTRLIAAVIVAGLVFSTGAAVALTHDAGQPTRPVQQSVQVDDLGRMVVTPHGVKYLAPMERKDSEKRSVIAG